MNDELNLPSEYSQPSFFQILPFLLAGAIALTFIISLPVRFLLNTMKFSRSMNPHFLNAVVYFISSFGVVLLYAFLNGYGFQPEILILVFILSLLVFFIHEYVRLLLRVSLLYKILLILGLFVLIWFFRPKSYPGNIAVAGTCSCFGFNDPYIISPSYCFGILHSCKIWKPD